jgi:hypothetical protein
VTIRRPTSARAAYAWHDAALEALSRGDELPRHDGLPDCGWYSMRRVKGGPRVPVEIRIEREVDPETGELAAPERHVAFVEGERTDARTIWTHLSPISRAEYLRLVERQRTDDRFAASKVAYDLAAEPTRPPR